MEENKNSESLRKSFRTAVIALIMAFLVSAAATFAWYMYNTSTHTTNVHMAAGAGASLEISNAYKGTYGSAAVLDEFVGVLTPVSTDKIANGFQRCEEFSHGTGSQPGVIATLFGGAETTDYYKTSLFLRTRAKEAELYIADISFEDGDRDNPISTAIRIGVVVHKPGENGASEKEFIFSINEERNLKGVYNTEKGKDGQVLDSTKTDGSTIDFKPYTSANYCIYNNDTGETSLKKDSVKIADLVGGPGDIDAVQVDIYIWLEGCDADCYNNLCGETLKNVAISFATTQQ